MDRLAVDAVDIVGSAEGPFDVSYTTRDLLLYALGIGATELRYLHENNPRFCAFPTYSLVLPYKGTSSDVVHFPGRTLFLIPAALRHVVNPGAILHYDQSIDIFRPLDPDGAELESRYYLDVNAHRSVVLGAYRKRGGVLLRTKTTLTSKHGDGTIAETTQGTFMRGLEIMGDVGPPLPPRPQPPAGAPDVVVSVTVSPHQAFLYRLSGDYNAIHVDPNAAHKAGLDTPILHGLCSLGMAARQIVLHFCSAADDDASSAGLLSLYSRFSRTVLPGDVLEIKMWGQAAHHPGSISGNGSSGASGSRLVGKIEAVASITSARSYAGDVHTEPKEATGRRAAAAAAAADSREGAPPGSLYEEKQQQQHEQLMFSPEPKEVIRFEVCSSRRGGAVVVADGRAVVVRRAREVQERQGSKALGPRRRAKL